MIKLSVSAASKYWLTSDSHYSHPNLVRGTTAWRNPDGTIPLEKVRNFKTLEEHNELIVKNINDLVGQDDVLIHLGDWSFGGVREQFA